jgi:7-keto-8-aminopelargonate synthetase-like enzyme
MGKSASFYETIDQIITHGVQKDILHLYNEDYSFTGNYLMLRGRRVVNFGSCSYLGLEFDERLKESAKEAIDRYGTQFSESRAYVSLKLYQDLEEAFLQIFGQPIVIVPTTTLGHLSNLPVLVQDEDAIIMDHQLHNSVQSAVTPLRARGVYTELIRHNRMDHLEDKVKELRSKHRKIWYMADGVYSMFGDNCPVDELYALMDRYPELHAYLDDAHGMSVHGQHGRGYVLRDRPMHPKLIIATSLAKAFATGGAVMVYPDTIQMQKVRNCGAPLLSSGPMQPATLGAALASARIHLTPEIYDLQADLHERIKFTNLMLKKYKLPAVSQPEGAVFFVGVSLPKMAYNMVARMLDAGFYVNLGVFPVVPMKQAGVRFTITRLHTFAQIEEMVATMARELPKAMKEEGITLAEIYKAFKMQMPEEAELDKSVDTMLAQSLSLNIAHYKAIAEVDRAEWNAMMTDRGSFDFEGMQTLETSFSHNDLPANNWTFDYVIVRDQAGKPVVGSFLTTGLWKDDMLSPAAVSRHVETLRQKDPYYLTSTVTAIGSLLTEGEHLYIDKTSPLWKEAVLMFIEKAYAIQEQHKAGNVVVRDFHGIDPELDTLMVDNGFVRIAMPETSVVTDLSWEGRDGYYESLSARSRQHYREDVRKHEAKFDVTVVTEYPGDAVIDQWYGLYQNVKAHSLELNTFDLPKKWFARIFDNPNWEVLTLSLKPGFGESDRPVCMVINYKGENIYSPMVIGLDYTHNKDYKIYRQALYQLVLRARELGKKKVCLGFAAVTEKKKVGAVQVQAYAYIHSRDTFNMEVLASLKENTVLYARQS